MKNPWEETREEYVTNLYGKKALKTIRGKVVIFKEDQRYALPAADAWFRHKELVQQAITSGKRVSEKVLKEYPEIIIKQI